MVIAVVVAVAVVVVVATVDDVVVLTEDVDFVETVVGMVVDSVVVVVGRAPQLCWKR